MALEPNDFCPCGVGNKVKFCCSADIVRDLDKVTRSIEGNQYAAALTTLSTLEESHGPLSSVLALKGIALLATSQFEKAKESADRFLEADPESPVAWAQAALGEEDTHEAMIQLQRAFEKSKMESIPQLLVPALQRVTDSLFSEGQMFSGFAHLTLQSALLGNQEAGMMRVLQFTQNQNIPLIIKQQLPLPSDEEVATVDGLEEAMSWGKRGIWLGALEKIRTLIESGDAPVLRKAAACLCTYLGECEEGATHWRNYAASCDQDSDEAIESEAYAQMLENQDTPDTRAIEKVTLTIENADAFNEQCIASRQLHAINDPGFANDDPDNPPPRSVFVILDKDMPTEVEGLTKADVPLSLGTIYLFGKQTDRDARIDIVPSKAKGLQEAIDAVSSVAGDLVGAEETREEVTNVPTIADELSWNPVWPREMNPADIEAIAGDVQMELINERFPAMELRAFGGKSANEIVLDFDQRIKVQAMLLIFESNMQCRDSSFTLDSLRDTLGIPIPETIDPTDADISDIPDIRMSRLDVTKMTAEQLSQTFSRASFVNSYKTTVNAAQEIVNRDEAPEGVSMADALGALVDNAETDEERLELLSKAVSACETDGRSPAPWLLRELPLRLMTGDSARASEIISTLETKHINEPGISQQLYGMLMQMGIMPPGMGAPGGGVSIGPPPGMGDPTAGGGVWTPGSAEADAPSAADDASGDSDDGGSKLWIPD